MVLADPSGWLFSFSPDSSRKHVPPLPKLMNDSPVFVTLSSSVVLEVHLEMLQHLLLKSKDVLTCLFLHIPCVPSFLQLNSNAVLSSESFYAYRICALAISAPLHSHLDKMPSKDVTCSKWFFSALFSKSAIPNAMASSTESIDCLCLTSGLDSSSCTSSLT